VLELMGTTVSSNRAGGGISSSGNSLSVLRVTKSTISSNLGFGIFNNLGHVTLTNSTVSSNSGDGIVNAEGKVIQGEVILNNATIALNGGVGVRNNFGGVFTFSNTILADDCAGIFISHDYNLVQFPTCTVIGVFGATTHDKIGVDPLLGDLRFNGGQTQTHKPGSDSPAIDNGNPAQVGSETFPPACASTDQTGVTRPLDVDGIDPDGSGPIPPAVCDIGAVEVRPPLLLNPDVICCVTRTTTLGVMDLTPAEATVRVGERFAYAFEWTVPEGGWRSLDTLELRLVDGAEVILRVRFAEAADPPGNLGTFSLVNERTGQEGPGFAPGSHNRLETNAATVYLDGSAAHARRAPRWVSPWS
jgi:hypothetical protein